MSLAVLHSILIQRKLFIPTVQLQVMNTVSLFDLEPTLFGTAGCICILSFAVGVTALSGDCFGFKTTRYAVTLHLQTLLLVGKHFITAQHRQRDMQHATRNSFSSILS